MTEEKLCDNCGEMCGDPYCGKCPHCGGELEDDYSNWPGPCLKCRLKEQKRQSREPLEFDL